MLNTSLMIAFVLVFSALFATANAQSPSTWISSNTGSSCSKQAANFFFLAPYSARTDPSEEGGTVYEVANDGFTALGLSYHTGDHYEVDLSEWLNTDLCLIHRLWPTRTVLNKTSPNYVGPVGSLVKAANKKVCNSLVSPSINLYLFFIKRTFVSVTTDVKSSTDMYFLQIRLTKLLLLVRACSVSQYPFFTK